MPNRSFKRHEVQRTTAVISEDFSLDRHVDDRLPPEVPLQYIHVTGPFSYDAAEGIEHGNLLGVIPDHDANPEALMVVRIGKHYFIRRRRTVQWMINRLSMHIVGHVRSTAPTKFFEVVGIVFLVLKFPPGANLNAVRIPFVDDRPVAVSGPVAGRSRRDREEISEGGGSVSSII